MLHMPLNTSDFLNYWCGQLFPVVFLISCKVPPGETDTLFETFAVMTALTQPEPSTADFSRTRRSLLTRLKNWDDHEGWKVFMDKYGR